MPLKQKLGRLKRDCNDIGQLMAALIKYADSDSTKDPESDDEKAGKGKKLGRNGEITSSSCSWGGNEMRRVHREAMERVGANRLGRNGCVLVFIGRASTEQAMETRPGVPHNGGNRPPTFGTGSY